MIILTLKLHSGLLSRYTVQDVRVTPLGVEDNREKTEKQKEYRIFNKECRISKGREIRELEIR